MAMECEEEWSCPGVAPLEVWRSRWRQCLVERGQEEEEEETTNVRRARPRFDSRLGAGCVMRDVGKKIIPSSSPRRPENAARRECRASNKKIKERKRGGARSGSTAMVVRNARVENGGKANSSRI